MKCPICSSDLDAHAPRPERDRDDFDCPNCGNFSLVRSVGASLGAAPRDSRWLAVVNHALRRMQRQGERPLVHSHNLKAIQDEGYLPDATGRLENLLIHLATMPPEPGAAIDLHPDRLRAVVGTIKGTAVGWILKQAMEGGFIQGTSIQTSGTPFTVLQATLTIEGWQFYRQLLAGGSRSRTAFMAMRFGDDQLDAIFRDHFKPSVKRAGFDLLRLDEEPKAGLIDDRLRLEIRRSRFLLAELSDGNSGAYWEAGYAEGLGRPVIYTCRKDVFDNPKTRPHFDTNHHTTIIWDPANIADAAERLVTTIRVTLPAEAKLTDN
jgi:hypothetical protein